MPQVSLTFSGSDGRFGSSCGSEVGFYDWYAYGCAVDLTKGRNLYFTDSLGVIPSGSIITQIDWSFNCHTSGPGSHTPGHISVQLVGYDDTTYFAMNKVDTLYSRTVYPGTLWTGDDLEMVYTHKNKDSLYAITHEFLLPVNPVIITYNPPSRNLFFGSLF